MRSLALLFLVTTVSVSALADPSKGECVEADTRAQTFRSAGKLRDARAQLEICMSQACPAPVRQDCTERLDEVMRVSPNVILDVKDRAGSDLAQATVAMDGLPFLDHLDGKAVDVDPGPHTFVVVVSGHAPVTTSVLVHEGDKARRVAVVIETEPHTVTSVTETRHDAMGSQRTEPVTTSSPLGPAKIAGLTMISLGVVGLGIGAAFGFVAMSKQSDAKCPSNVCQDETGLQALHSAGQAGDVSTALFVAGAVLGVAGLVVFIVAPKPTHIAVGFGPSGVVLGGVW